MGHPFYKKSYLDILPEKLSNEVWTKLHKQAHSVWDIKDDGTGPVVVRKMAEPVDQPRSFNPYRPQVDDIVSLTVSGQPVMARVASVGKDSATVYASNGATLADVPIDALKIALELPESKPLKDPERPDVVDKPTYNPNRHVTIQDSQATEQQHALATQLDGLLNARGGRLTMMTGPYMLVFERTPQGGVKRSVFKLQPQAMGQINYTSTDQLVTSEELSQLYPEIDQNLASAILGS